MYIPVYWKRNGYSVLLCVAGEVQVEPTPFIEKAISITQDGFDSFVRREFRQLNSTGSPTDYLDNCRLNELSS